MAWHSPLMTETMTGPLATVLCHLKEHGGTEVVITQISMDCTSAGRVTPMVSYGIVSMLQHQVITPFAIQT